MLPLLLWLLRVRFNRLAYRWLEILRAFVLSEVCLVGDEVATAFLLPLFGDDQFEAVAEVSVFEVGAQGVQSQDFVLVCH